MPQIEHPLIELAGIAKIYSTDEVESHVLKGIDFTIERGEFVSISGPSGCGKSTLLSIVGLLDTPSSGMYHLNGTRVDECSQSELAATRNREIGFIFQNFNLIGDLNVHDNVAIPLLYRGVAPSKRKQAVDAALERVEMSHRAKHYPWQLSGGQQQRVGVARAIVGEPAILLADEPTGNLDSTNGAMVMDLIAQLHKNGSTVCMVTHDPRYTGFATRSIRLFDGTLQTERHVAPEIARIGG